MNIDVRSVLVSDQLQAIEESATGMTSAVPHAVIERAAGNEISRLAVASGTWKILQQQLESTESNLQWSEDRSGKSFSVPLFLYMYEEDIATVLRFGLQFGGIATAILAKRYGASRVLIVHSELFGRPDGNSGYAVYVGLAMKVN